MADPLLLQDDEEYNSASDEEFDPTAAADDDDAASSVGSSSEDEPTAARKSVKRKRAKHGDTAEADLDSGDEATIAAARKRGSKKQRKDGGQDEDVAFLSDDDGGEGGLIKTRSQRRLEQKERRPLARIDGATADVDAIWAKLNSMPVGRTPEEEPLKDEDVGVSGGAVKAPAAEEGAEEEEMITIKRTYDFAGDRITEERQVPKSSAEARLYLAQQEEKQQQLERQKAGKKPDRGTSSSSATPAPNGEAAEEGAEGKDESAEKEANGKPLLRRPLHRPSRFDPNPTAEVKGLPPDKQLTWARRRALLDPTAASTPFPAATATATATATADENAAATSRTKAPPLPGKEKAQKLNTVDKSRLDWAGYVDKEGIADELDEYGRAKEGYLGRMDFLGRVDERREEERKAARAATRAQ